MGEHDLAHDEQAQSETGLRAFVCFRARIRRLNKGLEDRLKRVRRNRIARIADLQNDGIRLAVGRAVVAMVIAEFFTSISGLGAIIITSANNFDTATKCSCPS